MTMRSGFRMLPISSVGILTCVAALVSAWTSIVSCPAFSQELVWERTRQGYAADVAIDSENFVVALNDFEGQELMKYSPDGVLVWTHIDASGSHGAIAIDDADNIAMVSWLCWATKISPEGEVLWQTDLGDFCETLFDVACDDEGNVFLVGQLQGVFVAKLSPQGDILWSREESNVGRGMACAVDPWGDLIVASTEKGPGYPSYLEYDWKIYKYNSNGEKLWERREGGLWYEEALATCVDDEGNAYVGGSLYIAKYDRDGHLLWFDYDAARTIAGLTWDGVGSLYAGMAISPGYPYIAHFSSSGEEISRIPSIGWPDGHVVEVDCGRAECLAAVASVDSGPTLITAKYTLTTAAVSISTVSSIPVLRIHPNPIHDVAVFELSRTSSPNGRLCIHDLLGHWVRDFGVIGERRYYWDCRDDLGRRVAPGTYVCRVEDGRRYVGTTYIVIIP